MVPSLSEFKVDESHLHGVIGHYCAEQGGANPAIAKIAGWMEEGGSAQRRCLDAAAAAIMFSHLALSVADDAAFAQSLDDMRPFVEPELADMGREIFLQGLEVMLDSIGDARSQVSLRAATRRDMVLARMTMS